MYECLIHARLHPFVFVTAFHSNASGKLNTVLHRLNELEMNFTYHL